MERNSNSVHNECLNTVNMVLEHKLLSLVLVGSIAFVCCAWISFLVDIPKPRIADEFSYILAADTFLHGRLTNPVHPMWKYMETFHIMQMPSYMSKYPPAQAALLALGMLIAHPIVGVWLGMGLMAMSITWMIRSYLPSKWAFSGGLLAVFHFYLGVVGYWGQSYYGGAVAAIGGALFFGSLIRLVNKPHVKYSLIMGSGLLIMANSRPWEGFIAAVPASLFLIYQIFQKQGSIPVYKRYRSIIISFLSLCLLGIVFMGYYNYRITGDVFRMPYVEYERQYSRIPVFRWQKFNEPVEYRHDVMRKYYMEKTLPGQYDISGILNDVRSNIKILLRYYGILLLGGLYLGVPLFLSLFYARGRPWIKLFIFIVVFYAIVGSSCRAVRIFPHYSAPISPLVFLLFACGYRYMYDLRFRGYKIGRAAYIVSMCIYLLIFGIGVQRYTSDMLSNHYSSSRERVRIINELENMGGKHLILVKYGPEHSIHLDWVYNEANIDDSTVVWARYMEDNSDILEYFHNRIKWLLYIEKDNEIADLQRYP